MLTCCHSLGSLMVVHVWEKIFGGIYDNYAGSARKCWKIPITTSVLKVIFPSPLHCSAQLDSAQFDS